MTQTRTGEVRTAFRRLPSSTDVPASAASTSRATDRATTDRATTDRATTDRATTDRSPTHPHTDDPGTADHQTGLVRAQRRIRHDARDGLTAAGVSLAASVLVTLALAALLRWLG